MQAKVITQEYLADLEAVAEKYKTLNEEHQAVLQVLRMRSVTVVAATDGISTQWDVVLPPQYMADAKLESLLSALKANGIQGRWDEALGKWNLKLPNAFGGFFTTERKYDIKEVAMEFSGGPDCRCPLCTQIRATAPVPASDDQYVRLHVDDLIKLITRGTLPPPAKA
jgi:hypothetical protein